MKRSVLLGAATIGLFSAVPVYADVTVNGFASVAMGSSDSEDSFLGYEEALIATPDSKAGVQFDYVVNEKMDATLQFIARGTDDWNAELEWGYLTYTTDSGTKLRGGKLRAPLFLYSDYLDVKYAQPFLRPATVVYDLVPFTSYTGIDIVAPFELDDSTITLQSFIGGVDSYIDSLVLTLGVENLIGANINWEWESLSLRAIYAQADLTADSDLLDDKDASFSGLSLRYEGDSWFLISEYAQIEVEDAFSDTASAYVSVGYHLGSVTPYLVAGMTETTDNDEREGIPDYAGLTYERKEYSAGLRWDFMESVALKADVTLLTDFNDTNGDINFAFDSDGLDEDESVIYTIGLDAVF